jgi:hypothetical protein
MSAAVYRFLPWSRRGLAAELRDSSAAAAGALPYRASIKLQVTLTGGLGSPANQTDVAGPGDVIGLDLGQIVRLTPRANASNVEPNYLVAVDFDDPDLPWLLTPAAAAPQGTLRPWLVLIVVEDRPGVSIRVPAGAPLPQLRIETGATGELPDLTASWAWAHTQILVEQGTGLSAPGQLSDPDRHVSRLVAPRRLRANKRWHACLVPAFDAGVSRGLGLTPTVAPLGPAWPTPAPESIKLPVYYHWSFGTGAEGDFESLARRLRPFVIESAGGVPKVGSVKMHIGDAGGPVSLPSGAPGRIVQMDGALRAVQQDDGKLSEIPAPFQTPLGTLLDTIADPKATTADAGAVGPPLYGSWPANRFKVSGTASGWFAELNLDPRARVAAGLGAEVVRAEQEDLMTACWEQVGDVLRANSLLARARLSIEAADRFHARTLGKLTPERLLAFASPLASRTPLGARTVEAAIGPTSFPDAALDPAARRLTAPTARFVRKTGGLDAGVKLLATLAAGTPAVDPTAFVPAGIVPPEGVGLAVGAEVDLTPVGLPVKRPAADVEDLVDAIAVVRAQPPPPPGARLVLRGDLGSVGIITDRHVLALREISSLKPVRTDGVGELLSAAKAQPGAAGFLVTREGSALRMGALDITARNEIVRRTAPAEPNEVLARVATNVANPSAVIAALPPGALLPGRPPVVIDGGSVEGDPVIRPPRPPIEVDTGTIPAPVRDAAVLDRFQTAIAQLPEVSSVADVEPAKAVVTFALGAAASALRARCAPLTAHVARVATMVRLGDVALAPGGIADGLVVSPCIDRVMAYPELTDPAYRMLARYDRDRLLPGVDQIPPDSVTLLETNPRFIAAFMAGLNHELNRELLWRRYPTDQKGTPIRRFWDRPGGGADVDPLHTWRPLTRTLANRAGGVSDLVLLVRGELLRRYPNTVILAIPASGPDTPGVDESKYKFPIFSGLLDPDIAFFGFELQDTDLTTGNGWFFALQEQVTEPRFGLDETVDPLRVGAPGVWRAVAWPDTGITAGANFTLNQLKSVGGLSPALTNGANVADALFQNPVQVLVHARHLVSG